MFALIQNWIGVPIKLLWSHLLLQVADIHINEMKYSWLYNETKMKLMRCFYIE